MHDILLHCALIEGIGPAVVKRLEEQVDLSELYHATLHDFLAWGISPKSAQALAAGLADKKVLDQEKELLERHRLQFIDWHQREYPELLRHIHLPPLGLYVQGTLPRLERSCALVGSRAANQYGYDAVSTLVKELVTAGFVTVSGGAVGIDTAVHEVTVREEGHTVAVIGSGLLRPYPATNKKLFQTMIERGGAVVSPFPLEAQPLPGNFPARNRIIAGMTPGCVVVQAAQKSGALITARLALAEGREVGVVPGSIFDPLAAGCHELLRQGAALITGVGDIEEMLGFEVAPAPQQLPALAQFCTQPRSFSEMLEHEGCTEDELYTKLWDLQIAGRIEEVGGKWVGR